MIYLHSDHSGSDRWRSSATHISCSMRAYWGILRTIPILISCAFPFFARAHIQDSIISSCPEHDMV